MDASIRIGRIAGIEIGINWSWLIVFGLITWSLAAAVFPHENPGLADQTYLAMAVIAALAFFASILLHELGHAIEARRRGLEIAGVTLWLFGGVARFEGRFPDAGTEFRIAVAGPVVSLGLGLLLTVVAAIFDLPAAVDGVTAWLGYINLSLLVFNLLPALPLDGGRILRAALWQARRDFIAATRIAAAIGRGFGILLIFGGLFLFITVGAFGGAWLAFIGWFLLGAAEAELATTTTRSLLEDVRVGDVMVEDPVTARPEMTLREFIDELVTPHRYTAYPVLDHARRPLGLISFRAVAPVPADDWTEHTVAELMQPLDAVTSVAPDDRLSDVLAKLAEGKLNRALVCADGRVVGLLSITDVTRMVELRSFEAGESDRLAHTHSRSESAIPPLSARPGRM